MRVLWLRPSKGENISVRRERIAQHLREWGVEVDIQDCGGVDLLPALRTAVLGDYDIIAGNVRVGLFVGYPLAKLLRKPFLGDVSDPISDIEYLPKPLFDLCEWYEWWILSRADASVVVYESTLNEARSRGIDVVRLPNAVDFEQFARPQDTIVDKAQDILLDAGVDLDKPIAVYIGGFTANYHITEIVEAASHAPSWEFVFIGEGPLKHEITTSTSENVFYCGSHKYELIPGFLRAADAGFCFKNAEQPLKLKEYGASGIPAIVQPGELQRWYDDNELVFIQPDPESISAKLKEFETNPKKIQQYGKTLQIHAENYSWKDIAEEYYQLFQRIKST